MLSCSKNFNFVYNDCNEHCQPMIFLQTSGQHIEVSTSNNRCFQPSMAIPQMTAGNGNEKNDSFSIKNLYKINVCLQFPFVFKYLMQVFMLCNK